MLGATQLGGRRPAACEARWFARTALLSLGLVLLAGLFGVSPFGGVPRHAMPIYPGILIAGILVLLVPLRDADAGRRSLRWAAATLGVLVALPGGVVLARTGRDPRTHEELAAEIHASRYRAAPAPVVTDLSGRSLASWWLLPDARPVLRPIGGARLSVYDYGGVPVVQSANLADAVRTAVFYADVAEASWLFLTVAKGESAEQLEREILAAVRASPGVRVEIADHSSFVYESVTVRLAREPVAAGVSSQRSAS